MKNIKKRQGFTLIELSIVLVVVGIMLYAGIAIGAIQVEAAKLKQTKDKINKIDRALQLYLETNNSLPCPSDGELSGDDNNYGKGVKTDNAAVSDATCANVTGIDVSAVTVAYMGVVPTRDLDLPDDFMVDGWGNKISYAVSRYCVDKENWSDNDQSSRFKCTTGADGNADYYYDVGGSLSVLDNTGHTSRTAQAVYVVLSHGKNGLGGYTNEGARIMSAAESSQYDLDNAGLTTADGTSGDATNIVFRDDLILDYDGATAEDVYFDDVVSWKTGPQMWFEKTK